jgi:hypothetical protein
MGIQIEAKNDAKLANIVIDCKSEAKMMQKFHKMQKRSKLLKMMRN